MTRKAIRTISPLTVIMAILSRTGILSINPNFLVDSVKETGTLIEYVSVRMLSVILSYMGTIYEQYLDEKTKMIIVNRESLRCPYHIARSEKITDTSETDAFAWNGDIQKRHFDKISSHILNTKYADYISKAGSYSDITALVVNLGTKLQHGVPGFHFEFMKSSTSKSLEKPRANSMSTSMIPDDDNDDIEVICSDDDDAPAGALTLPVSILYQ